MSLTPFSFPRRVSRFAGSALFSGALLFAVALSGCGGGSGGSSSTPPTTLESRIAFVSNRDGNLEIYSMKPDGSDVKRLTNSASVDTQPCWSWDRKRIAFTSNRSGSFQIWTMNRDGGELTQWTNGNGALQPSFGPDGRIVYTFGALFVLDAPNAAPRRLLSLESYPDPQSEPFWAKNGQILFVNRKTPTIPTEQLRLEGAVRSSSITPYTTDLATINADGTGFKTLLSSGIYAQISLPSNSSQIGFTLSTVGGGSNNGFYIAPFPIPTGSQGVRVTATNGQSPFGSVLSPDGSQLTWSEYDSGNPQASEIYLLSLSTRSATNITTNSFFDGLPSWR